ncbi:MAG: ATP-binding protein [Chloroflexota bacterium]
MLRKYELSVTSELDNLASIGQFIADTTRALGLSGDESFAVEMAVDEACANVIEHAYDGKPDGTIEVTCYLEEDRLVVTIRDHGEPFDPASVRCPDTECSLKYREVGGLGLHFMRTLMDEVWFEFDTPEGNVLRMTKVRH